MGEEAEWLGVDSARVIATLRERLRESGLAARRIERKTFGNGRCFFTPGNGMQWGSEGVTGWRAESWDLSVALGSGFVQAWSVRRGGGKAKNRSPSGKAPVCWEATASRLKSGDDGNGKLLSFVGFRGLFTALTTAAAAATVRGILGSLVARLLEVVALLRGEHFFDFGGGLGANLFGLGGFLFLGELGVVAEFLQFLGLVLENGSELGFLVGREFGVFAELIHSVATCGTALARGRTILFFTAFGSVRGEGWGSECSEKCDREEKTTKSGFHDGLPSTFCGTVLIVDLGVR